MKNKQQNIGISILQIKADLRLAKIAIEEAKTAKPLSM